MEINEVVGMKCNICGGDMPYGESVCKFCGNVMTENVKSTPVTASIPKEEAQEKPRVRHDDIDVPEDARVYRSHEYIRNPQCPKCGRPLDGTTNKCIVCDRQEVGRSKYQLQRDTEEDLMAKKKSKKKKHTTRNIILSIFGLIILFALTMFFTVGPMADYLGIGFKIGERETPPPATEYTQKPKNTWEPDRDKTPEPTEEATRVPTKTPTPHEQGDPVKLRGGDYLYDTHTHLITEKELERMTRSEIRLIYWEIFARHGLTFEGDLADYFEMNHKWYMPTTMDENEAKAKFNDIEKRNEKTIFDYQKKQGWR